MYTVALIAKEGYEIKFKQINVRKKTDWRMGETFQDVNDDMFAKDARKYHRKMMVA